MATNENSSGVSVESPAIRALKERYFRDGAAEVDRAAIYTVREDVSGMRQDFQKAGVPRAAVKFDRATKLFFLEDSAVTDKTVHELGLVMSKYGVGGPGQKLWAQEREGDREMEGTVRRVLQSETVRSGAAVDLRSHREGVVEAALVEAGAAPGVAAVVARETASLHDRYSAEVASDGIVMPSDDELLAEAAASVDADIDAVLLEHAEMDVAGAAEAATLDERRYEVLRSYIIRDGSTPFVNTEVGFGIDLRENGGDIYVLEGQDADKARRSWQMKFAFGSDLPVAVAMSGRDDVFNQRRDRVVELIAPFRDALQRDHQAMNVFRDPLDPASLRIGVTDESLKTQVWDVKFKPQTAQIEEMRCDGKEVAERTLFMAGQDRGATLERVAARLDTQITKPGLAVLTVPMSERAEFDRIKSQTEAVTRYDSRADNGNAKPGGWYLLKGDPADFAKWTGPDAYAKFVEEGNNRFRNQKVLEDVARSMDEGAQKSPYGHLTRGVMLPTLEAAKEKFISGYKDNSGRDRRGLGLATADELRELARLTSRSHQDLDRRESVIRLEVMVRNSPKWKERYDALPGGHDDKISGLLPRTAADGKMGFGGLNFGSNRGAWTVEGREASLPEQDKKTMQALFRGFDYLRTRYAEVAGKPLDFSLSGVKLSEHVEKRNVGAETTIVAAAPNEKAKAALAQRFLGGVAAGR